MAKDKQEKETKGALVVVIDPRQRLTEWDGTPTVARYEPTRDKLQAWITGGQEGPRPVGKERPEDEQTTICNLFLGLLRYWEPEKAEQKFLAGRIGQHLALAAKTNKKYRPGDFGVGILGQVVKDYRDGKVHFPVPPPMPGQPPQRPAPADALILAQLAEAVGLDTGYKEGAAGEIVD